MLNLDFADPKTNADPFPIFAQLRESDPVHWSSAMKVWVVTRYDDVKRVAEPTPICRRSDWRRSSPRCPPEPGQLCQFNGVPRKLDGLPRPARPTRLRRLFTKAFTSRSIKALEPNVEEIVALLFDEMEQKARSTGVVDWIADFAYPLPATVMMDLCLVCRGRTCSSSRTGRMKSRLSSERHAPRPTSMRAPKPERKRWRVTFATSLQSERSIRRTTSSARW